MHTVSFSVAPLITGACINSCPGRNAHFGLISSHRIIKGENMFVLHRVAFPHAPTRFCARSWAPSFASLPVTPPTFFLYHACRSHATSYYACIVGSTRRWQRVCVLERRSRPASNSASVTSSRIFPARSEPHRTVANQPFSHDNRARGWCRGCICRGTCAIHVDTGQQRCQETDR